MEREKEREGVITVLGIINVRLYLRKGIILRKMYIRDIYKLQRSCNFVELQVIDSMVP